MTNWVDQARNVARELVAAEFSGQGLSLALLSRIASDPDLFWLRGEEMPPGEPPCPPQR